MKGLLVLFIAVSTTAQAATGVKCWESPQYELRKLPPSWLPATAPDANEGLQALGKSNAPYDFQVSKFIGNYGLPTAYVVATGRHHDGFLIYKLPDNNFVSAYLGSTPFDRDPGIGAFITRDKDCKFLRLIK